MNRNAWTLLKPSTKSLTIVFLPRSHHPKRRTSHQHNDFGNRRLGFSPSPSLFHGQDLSATDRRQKKTRRAQRTQRIRHGSRGENIASFAPVAFSFAFARAKVRVSRREQRITDSPHQEA